MFKLIMRAQVNWISGFGRYADLFLAMVFLVVGYHSQSWFWLSCGIIALISFALDFNGRVQRWVVNQSISKVVRR